MQWLFKIPRSAELTSPQLFMTPGWQSRLTVLRLLSFSFSLSLSLSLSLSPLSFLVDKKLHFCFLGVPFANHHSFIYRELLMNLRCSGIWSYTNSNWKRSLYSQNLYFSGARQTISDNKNVISLSTLFGIILKLKSFENQKFSYNSSSGISWPELIKDFIIFIHHNCSGHSYVLV